VHELEREINGTVWSVTFARSRNRHYIDHCAGSGLSGRMKLVAPSGSRVRDAGRRNENKQEGSRERAVLGY